MINEDNSNQSKKNETNKPRNKRPEMARYQPPNTRTNTNSITNLKSYDSDNSSKRKNKPENNFEKETKNEIAKDSIELKEEQNQIKNSNISKTPNGGLLKLNQTIINEIISKNEKLTLNDEDKNSLKETKDTNKPLIINSSHSDRFQQNKPSPSNDNTRYRTLFDPNNPDKPIYVELQNRSNSNLKLISSLHSTTNHSRKESVEEKLLNNEKMHLTNENKNENIIKVNNMCKKSQDLENSLKMLIDSFEITQSIENFLAEVNILRKQIEKLCIDSLFTHLETATNLNIDLNHWRSCYHHLIETLRKEYNLISHQNRSSTLQLIRDELNKVIAEYIDEGVLFYKNLIERLEIKILRFKSTHYIDLNFYDKTLEIINNPQTTKLNTIIKSKDMKYALACINRLLICLGDLERYREMIYPSQSNQRDYSIARSYYLKSMCLSPKSSRAYHQLAILAIYTKRRLDACYYYFRCLEVSQPLTSVRQSLNSIFEEVRLKSDSINKAIKNAILLKKEKMKKDERKNTTSNSFKNRVEIWYKPLFSSNLKSISSTYNDNEENDSNDDEDLIKDSSEEDLNEKKLSLNELNKRFMLNYLNTIGKLFTKVGMETYDEVCSNMLKEFGELLNRSPCPLGKIRLLQINVINISTIDLIYKSSTQTNPDGSLTRSQLLECSIQLSMDMFSLIANRFNNLFKKCKCLSDDSCEINLDLNYEWNHFFPSIKLYLDWMLCNLKLWHPLPDQLSPDLGPNPNRGQILLQLFNLINKNIQKFDDKNIRNDFYMIKLEEDLELAGFVPLLSLPREDYDYQNNIDLNNINYIKSLNELIVEKEKIKKRMQKVLLFADYLCGLEEPLLKYDVSNKCYIQVEGLSLKLNKINERPKKAQKLSTCSSSSIKSNDHTEAISNEDLENNLDLDTEESNDELIELKSKHRMLKAKMAEKQIQEQKFQSLVEANTQRQIELEIRPKFIVADTNCFIDHLNLIEKILNTNYYILIVPLLVINELEKLAKSISNLNDDSLEHAEYLQRNAKKSIEFLNNKFDKRERNIKAMTSQGSVLETIQFKTEEVVKPGTNDELILGCCLYYCRDNARDFMPQNKNDAIHLFRDVVLLTEDRHLRLKAHTRNVPVKDIRHFCKWSGLFYHSNENNNKQLIQQKKNII